MSCVQSDDSCSTKSSSSDWSERGRLATELRRHFSGRDLRYITAVLTPDELGVIRDTSDALIIARIKRMPNRRLAKFDKLVPIDDAEMDDYFALQLQWLRDEEYLLGTRLGRSPTQKELFIDFMKNHNGLRFRAYFAMKFPGKMRPCAMKLAAGTM